MQISVTFRNIEPSDALRDYATEKIERLSKYVKLAGRRSRSPGQA